MTRSSGTQGDGMCGQEVPITDRKAQPKWVRRGTIVAYAVVLVSASAVFAVMMPTSTPASAEPARSLIMPVSSPSPTMAGDMPGMDHGSADMPVSSPSPTMAGDMPGMDHGFAPAPGSSPSRTSAADSPMKTHEEGGTGAHSQGDTADMPGMDHGDTAAAAKDRPLAPVLGTFGGATSVVLLSAAFLRRRDRAQRQAKQAARAVLGRQRIPKRWTEAEPVSPEESVVDHQVLGLSADVSHMIGRRTQFQGRTLSGWLITRFVIAGLVPLLAAASLLFAQQQSAAESQARHTADARAASVAADLSRELASWRTQLLVASNNPVLREWYAPGANVAALRPEVNQALIQLNTLNPDLIDEACFIDAGGLELGRQTKGVPATITELSPDESEAPFFQPTLALPLGQVHQNTPYLSEDSKRWVISNSTPIVVGGRKVAFLHFESNLDAIRTRLASVAGSDLAVRVVDTRTLTTIADSRSTEPIIGQPLAKSSTNALPAEWQHASATVKEPTSDQNHWNIEVAVAPAPALNTGLLLRLAGLILLTVAALTLLARRSARVIVEPLRRITAVATALANGDLDQRTQVTRKDEIGQTAAAVDQASSALHAVISAVVDHAAGLATAAQQLQESNDLISANAERTSTQAQHATTAAEEVAHNVRVLSMSAEQMSASIAEIAEITANASDAGVGAVAAARSTDASMQRLDSSSTEIGDVVKSIEGIAGQTNLLALNATIEAARAAEAGKGFAVVAAEVKGLARQTALATADITQRIQTMQESSGGVVKAIADITVVIDKVNHYQSTIAAAVDRQAATTKVMEDNVASTVEKSDAIAANVAGLADVARTTSNAVDDAQSATTSLSHISDELLELVGQFRR